MIRPALLFLLVASTAQANVWDNALSRGRGDALQDKYDGEMRNGDEHAMLANSKGISYREAKTQVAAAITAYRAAAGAKPKEAEPWYRIGAVLHSFYLECEKLPQLQLLNSVLCNKDVFDRKHAEEAIEAWDQFEARAPLDPRLSVDLGHAQILFERAILHTKLATKPHLEAAARDYEKILSRNDGTGDTPEQVLGNLAETYMMLDRLDDSIETYREACRSAADTSTWYGYAVALDRDDHPQQALEVIRSQGPDQRELFRNSIAKGTTFYVPEGEKFYYFALSDEAFGFDDLAADNWRQYIASGAHPEFQPRAKAHIDALQRHGKKHKLPIEPPWQEIFH